MRFASALVPGASVLRASLLRAWIVAASIAATVVAAAVPVAAAEFGTREEAMAMVRRVQEKFRKDGPEATFTAVNAGARGFLDRDLFVYIHRIDGKALVANSGIPSIVGRNLYDLKDQDGKFTTQEFMKIATTPPYHGWSDYRWLNPKTGLVEDKSAWVERLGDNYLVGVGIYKSEQPNENTIGVISGSPNSDDTYLQVAYDLADVLNDNDDLRILPIGGIGGTRNIRDVRYLRGVDIGLTQTNILNNFRRSNQRMGQNDDKIVYIAKLFNEEVHLVARSEITSVEQLRGRKVNLDAKASGTSYSMRDVFKSLGIEVEEVSMSQVEALEKVKSGEIAATALIAGKPVRSMSRLSARDGLHFVAIPYAPQLVEDYLPATLSQDDYPDLVAPGETVDTVAVGTVLIAYNPPKANAERYGRVQRFVEAFFGKIDEFRKPPRHVKWREVNLAATLPGWNRLPAAQEWLKKHDPDDLIVYSNRGTTHLASGEYDLAIADFDQAIRLNPGGGDLYGRRGLAYSQKGDFVSAMADLNKAIELNPAAGRGYVNRAAVLAAHGDRDLARADVQMALKLEPALDSAPEMLKIRAALLSRVGEQRAAESKPVERAGAQAPRDGEAAPRRVALLVANSRYRTAPGLPNPRRDAEAVAAALRQAGFQSVELANDLDHDGMMKALRNFRDEADRADWALLYYAGHGIEIDRATYLVPVDARLADDRDAKDEAVSYEAVLNSVRGAAALRLIVLDACRVNAFKDKMHRSIPGRSATDRGLAAPPETEPGTLTVYAAREGEVAEDDANAAVSAFARAFVAEIKMPGIEVRRTFDNVRDDVVDATRHRQQPSIYGALPGRRDFFFTPDTPRRDAGDRASADTIRSAPAR